jgi:hypothetical protein
MEGDLFGEDRLCSYEPQGGDVIQPLQLDGMQPVSWEAEAEGRLSNLPFFLQKMIRGKVEQAARDRQLDVVNLALMDELRQARFGNKMPKSPFAKKKVGS